MANSPSTPQQGTPPPAAPRPAPAIPAPVVTHVYVEKGASAGTVEKRG